MLLVLDDIGYYHLYCFKGLFVKSRTLTFFYYFNGMVWIPLFFFIPGGIFSMSQEFLEIWAGVPLKPDHSRSGLVPYEYGVICPSARYIKPCIKGLLPVGLLH